MTAELVERQKFSPPPEEPCAPSFGIVGQIQKVLEVPELNQTFIERVSANKKVAEALKKTLESHGFRSQQAQLDFLSTFHTLSPDRKFLIINSFAVTLGDLFVPKTGLDTASKQIKDLGLSVGRYRNLANEWAQNQSQILSELQNVLETADLDFTRNLMDAKSGSPLSKKLWTINLNRKATIGDKNFLKEDSVELIAFLGSRGMKEAALKAVGSAEYTALFKEGAFRFLKKEEQTLILYSILGHIEKDFPETLNFKKLNSLQEKYNLTLDGAVGLRKHLSDLLPILEQKFASREENRGLPRNPDFPIELSKNIKANNLSQAEDLKLAGGLVQPLVDQGVWYGVLAEELHSMGFKKKNEIEHALELLEDRPEERGKVIRGALARLSDIFPHEEVNRNNIVDHLALAKQLNLTPEAYLELTARWKEFRKSGYGPLLTTLDLTLELPSSHLAHQLVTNLKTRKPLIDISGRKKTNEKKVNELAETQDYRNYWFERTDSFKRGSFVADTLVFTLPAIFGGLLGAGITDTPSVFLPAAGVSYAFAYGLTGYYGRPLTHLIAGYQDLKTRLKYSLGSEIQIIEETHFLKPLSEDETAEKLR